MIANDINKVFTDALDKLEKPMSRNEGVPCRVTADLRRYEREQERAERKPFDIEDDDLMHDVCGSDRWKNVIVPLLKSLESIEAAQMFKVNDARALERLIPELKALRGVCIDAYNDL
jgi:hypothetical protein